MSGLAQAAAVAVGRLDGAVALLTVERRLVGLALLRIACAGVVLCYLLGQWPNRHLLWGPSGAHPIWLFERELLSTQAPSLLATSSPLAFELVYHLSIVVGLLCLIGWRARLVGITFFAVAWSLLHRNVLVMTGGDSLLLLILPWLLLTNTSAYLSVDSGWRGISSDWRPAPRPWRALLHNLGLFGMVLQLSTMYLFAGLHKLFGAPWLDGSAAGAVLRTERFSHPLLGPLISQHAIVSQIVTAWTVVFELTSPLLLWLPATRWLVATQSVLFHGGIAIMMGLATFAVEATMLQLVVFPDASYRRLIARLRIVGTGQKSAAPSPSRPARSSSINGGLARAVYNSDQSARNTEREHGQQEARHRGHERGSG